MNRDPLELLTCLVQAAPFASVAAFVASRFEGYDVARTGLGAYVCASFVCLALALRRPPSPRHAANDSDGVVLHCAACGVVAGVFVGLIY